MSLPKICPMCGAEMSESGQCTKPENHSIIRRSSEFSDLTHLSEQESKEMARRIKETGYAFDISGTGMLDDTLSPPADLRELLEERDKLRRAIETDEPLPEYLTRDDHRIGD